MGGLVKKTRQGNELKKKKKKKGKRVAVNLRGYLKGLMFFKGEIGLGT